MSSREIDYLIAEHIFAYDFVDWEEPAKHPVPNYSTSIADAWRVFTKMSTDELFFDLHIHKETSSCGATDAGTPWCVMYDDGDDYETCYASTPEMALCLAALKAKGVEVPGE